ncbi:EF-P beta-lysylation protein EpmB [Salinispirillum marinum]|uniref:L-lysine 2,3-aminomutase n=2 Tax=Saccharospirillaceae TaxID=255527 RepID=A0ABV8BA75_9GAMM
MIPVNSVSVQPVRTEKTAWQQQLGELITDLPSLLHACQLVSPPEALADLERVSFPVRTTRFYASLVTPGDWHDPLLRQILPWQREQHDVPGFSIDPLQERSASPLPGLIHKYRTRVLLVPTSACAIHCRYCFRRHFPYDGHRIGADERQAIVRYLHEHPDVNEVIFSGGDPLMLTDKALHHWLQDLATVPHLDTVRFHSRLPIVLPDRLTPELQNVLTATRLQPVLVLHANHGREISPALSAVIAPWQRAGITLLNQAVLLAGVNDNLLTLRALSKALFAAHILPYYLHQLDSVAGAAHFAVPDEKALLLHEGLKEQLPGYLVPRLVREIPEQPNKTWLPAEGKL